ncbi:MAG: cytochrome c, partial [Rhodothermaceae bacterium]|nr:cytochrome c [Rhodothermaceae bacterium]
MKYALPVVATLAAFALLALLFPYTGLYDVSAAAGHTSLEAWYLSTLSRRSIQARAGDVAVPAGLSDSAAVARGAVAYAQMCQTCHGGPGAARSVTGEGLTPTPPRLSEAADRWA